jgi:BASS family bile acid:Na+ symporter
VPVIPFGLRLLLGVSLPLSPLDILQELALIVLLPFAAGTLLRTAAPKLAALAGAMRMVSSLAVILLAGIVAAGLRQSAQLPNPALVILLSAVFCLGGLGAGRLLATFLRLRPAPGRAVVLASGMREFGIATAVALTFLGPAAASIPAVYGLVMLLLAAWTAKRMAGSRPSSQAPGTARPGL